MRNNPYEVGWTKMKKRVSGLKKRTGLSLEKWIRVPVCYVLYSANNHVLAV